MLYFCSVWLILFIVQGSPEDILSSAVPPDVRPPALEQADDVWGTEQVSSSFNAAAILWGHLLRSNQDGVLLCWRLSFFGTEFEACCRSHGSCYCLCVTFVFGICVCTVFCLYFVGWVYFLYYICIWNAISNGYQGALSSLEVQCILWFCCLCVWKIVYCTPSAMWLCSAFKATWRHMACAQIVCMDNVIWLHQQCISMWSKESAPWTRTLWRTQRSSPKNVFLVVFVIVPLWRKTECGMTEGEPWRISNRLGPGVYPLVVWSQWTVAMIFAKSRC